MKNCFYIFEGIDGSGKTSLINELKKKLNEKHFYFTKEPCGTIFAPYIKELINLTLQNNDYISQYLLFAAERSYHIKNIIIPKLNEGFNVISDRFFYSSLVYQGININSKIIETIYLMTNYNIIINKIFFCKISAENALQRIEKRNYNDNLDNHYKDKLFLLEKQYNKIFQDNNLVITLDMTLPIQELIKIVIKEII
jgi:dTMP kinase